MEHLLQGLNEVQRKAVTNITGPSLVIAGAGSGKTRVLTFRIAYLLQQGIQPSNILSLTFTNKAAREMKERIGTIVDKRLANQLWMGTFHSIFAKILRFEAGSIGYSSNFTIYDTVDSKNLIKKIIKDLGLDAETYKPGDVLSRISTAKNNLISHQAYASNSALVNNDRTSRKPAVVDIYREYAIRCKKAGAMDFDDLLLNTNVLFRDHPDILQKYQNRFKYILVDEYQDTNFSQYLIVNKLSAKEKNVCVVGDDAQSIYAFRGAKIENILNFRKDYPTYQLFKLEQNYRSTQTIVDAANSVIAKNKEQIQKKVFSANEAGDKIKITKAYTDGEEGIIVASSILEDKYRFQLQYYDFAILYRTNAQSRIFEEALRKKNIPYRIYGSVSFYQRKEIKDIMGYYRMAINPKDDEALKRIINYPARGIGQTTQDKLEAASNQMGTSIWDVIKTLEQTNPGLNKGTLTKLFNFRTMMEEFIQRLPQTEAYEMATEIANKTGIYRQLYNGDSIEDRSRFENLEELLNGIKEFADGRAAEEEGMVTLDQFMENVALLTDADTDNDEDKDKVSLMTIHASKGLEFEVVHIVGLEEELFPSRLSVQNPKELEEERRLFYVALTRAKKKVSLSYAESRYKWGDSMNCKPSRFLGEIDQVFLDMMTPQFEAGNDPDLPEPGTRKPFKRKAPNAFTTTAPNPHLSQMKRKLTKINEVKNATNQFTPPDGFVPDDPEKISEGMLVTHLRFGPGEVRSIEGNDSQKKARIYFKNTGQEKVLLLKFARLKIIG